MGIDQFGQKKLENSLVSMMRDMRASVRGLVALVVGLKSSDSESERSSSMVLVDLLFFCCPRRCPLLVASDFGR